MIIYLLLYFNIDISIVLKIVYKYIYIFFFFLFFFKHFKIYIHFVYICYHRPHYIIFFIKLNTNKVDGIVLLCLGWCNIKKKVILLFLFFLFYLAF